MTKITSNKLISYSIIDFPSETHLELGTKFFEEQASEFFNKAKKKGLLRWRMNRVWNKQGGFTLSQVFEYKDDKSFKECQNIINEFNEKYKKNFSLMNAKIMSSRAITLLDYISSDYTSN